MVMLKFLMEANTKDTHLHFKCLAIASSQRLPVDGKSLSYDYCYYSDSKSVLKLEADTQRLADLVRLEDPSCPWEPKMSRLPLYIIALWAFIISVTAACKCSNEAKRHVYINQLTNQAPPSFCKCTCFSNSTIIRLSSNSPPPEKSTRLDMRAPAATCTMCNRAFCLSQRLPFCKNAEEKDVFTTCFQRDSRKDQIVVLTFIAATLGLLGYAGVRKVIEKRKASAFGSEGIQQGYVAVGR